jgi:hypothetical protein
MSENPHNTTTPRSLSGSALRAQDAVPRHHWEIPKNEGAPSTSCQSGRACDAQGLDIFPAGHDAVNGVPLPVTETYIEMNAAATQPNVNAEYYEATQRASMYSSLVLSDILSEIRQLQLQLMTIEQALSNLWYTQQTPFWDCTYGYTESSVPDFKSVQEENDCNPTWPSQYHTFSSDDTKTQK